jgi:hypothetical protein
LLYEKYSLNTLACDVEICNPRTDFRFGRIFTPVSTQITEKKIPHPKELNDGQIIWIMDQMLVRTMAWLNGWPISHCFYDFAYYHHHPDIFTILIFLLKPQNYKLSLNPFIFLWKRFMA